MNAYFSYRVATRRHSLILPNNRSITFRPLYFSELNGKDAPASFALYGITHSMPTLARYSRIAPDENALSPDATSGRTGSGFSSDILIPCKTEIKYLLSCSCPAHIVTESAKILRSAAAMIFVVRPPRDFPMAWSSGSSSFFLTEPRQRPCERE